MNKITKVVCLIIVIMVFIFALIYFSVDNKNYETEEIEDFTKYYTSETVVPRNVGEFYAYEGVNEYTDVCISMNVFTNYISDLQKNFEGIENTEELKKFFSENQSEIKSKISISKEEDFLNLVKYINKYNVDKEKLDYAEIVSNSAYIENNYFWVVVKFYYLENDEPISFKVGLATKANNKVIVKYNFTQYLEEESETDNNAGLVENVIY